MLRRSFFVSCVVFAGALAGCVGVLGDFTVDDVLLPDATTDATADGGTSSGDGSTPGEVDTGAPDVLADAPRDAKDDAEAGCAPPTVSCGGNACFDLANAKQHCGACDNACLDGNGAAACAQRRCGCVNPAHKYCDKAGCFATNNDPQHCGDDCRVCPTSSTCQGGACVCDAKFAECQPGTCVSLETDTNCGRCGNTCGAGATCLGGKCRYAQAGASCKPWGLAYGATSDSIYWTEFCSSGGAIRKCPLASGCQTLPPALYSAGVGSLPCGVVAAKGSDSSEYFFNTDNQGPNNNRLWRTLTTGTSRTDWSGFSTGGPSSIVTNGVNVWFGTSGGVLRAAINTTGATPVLNANPSVLPGPGSTPQSIALDALNLYAGRHGLTGKTDGVVACPIAGDCTVAGELQIFSGSGVSSIVSDGLNVFISTRANMLDRVYRCPLAGCAAGATPFWTANLADNPGRHVALAIDSNNVYINSRNGQLVSCPKGGATCAGPKVLHGNVNAGSMITLGGYVYWTDDDSVLRGVYRTLP